MPRPRSTSSFVRCSVPAAVRLAGLSLGVGLVAALGLFACGSAAHSGFDAADSGPGSTPATDGGPGGGPGLIGGEGGTSDSGGGVQAPAEVWGHSPDTLYEVDPNTKAVTVVGKFNGCSNVIDLALDHTAVNMFVTTQDGLYKVDKASAKCTFIASGSYPNSLSFVPAGTLDPTVEALVGYVGDTYVRIDTSSGAISNVGSLGAGSGIVSSGDIVSVINGPSYLTVTGGSSCGTYDCLVSVDPKTGKMTQNYGSVGQKEVFGLAFWAGTVYGFDNKGGIFSVTVSATGQLTTANIPVPGAPSGLQFWGAGSTTSAPPHGPS